MGQSPLILIILFSFYSLSLVYASGKEMNVCINVVGDEEKQQMIFLI